MPHMSEGRRGPKLPPYLSNQTSETLHSSEEQMIHLDARVSQSTDVAISVPARLSPSKINRPHRHPLIPHPPIAFVTFFEILYHFFSLRSHWHDEQYCPPSFADIVDTCRTRVKHLLDCAVPHWNSPDPRNSVSRRNIWGKCLLADRLWGGCRNCRKYSKRYRSIKILWCYRRYRIRRALMRVVWQGRDLRVFVISA